MAMTATRKTPSKRQPAKAPPLEAYRLATYLASQMRGYYPALASLSPAVLDQTIPRWANDISKINRIDGQRDGVDASYYNYKSIAYVIKWATTDHFWRQNIKSGSKLRAQYDTLIMRIIDTSRYKKRKVSRV